ncbi:MAG: hypothetical protein KBF48_01280 [Xanthomonadales bacterium]|nr:hypothetical protein [Xanthomonadales bacterium]
MSGLSDALRSRYAATLAQADSEAMRDAAAAVVPLGVAQDRFIRAVLEEWAGYGAAPSPATLKAYRRDHERLWASGATPLDKATTYQHFNRLRSACRFIEAEAIAELRIAAEAARRAKQTDVMRGLTQAAFERAAVFRALYLDSERPTWSQKSAAMRADGKRPCSKSKRRAARSAPTPDALLHALMTQPRRLVRVEVLAAVFAVFGIRPKELENGVRLEASADGVKLCVKGAKVDAVRGQPERLLHVGLSSVGQSALALSVLTDYAKRTDGWIRASPSDTVAVRRAMKQVQRGLSPYAYRHARASDAKAAQGSAGAAEWLGHSTDRVQSLYGNRRSGKGTVTIIGAMASREVRKTKQLPLSCAQRFARVAARLAVRSCRTVAPKPASPPGRKPRLRM